MELIPGLAKEYKDIQDEFCEIHSGGNGMFFSGKEGVRQILTPRDNKSEFIVYDDKTLVFVKSQMGYPALYELKESAFEGPAEAVLMDLDGTSVKSEGFWIWIIQQVTANLLGNFSLEGKRSSNRR